MKRLVQLFLVVLPASAALAQSMSIIELRNRPADELIPVIEPMLGADDAISGEGYTMFLRSSPETLARVRSMVDVLDVAAKVLQVSVFQGSEQELGQLGISADIRIERGNAGVEIGSETDIDDAAGGRVTYSTSGGSASVSGVATQRRLRDNPVHQVRVTEGTQAWIETGERIPFFFATRAGPLGVASSVEYRDAVTGFYVLPRVRGENVVLEVSPFKSSAIETGGDGIDTQSAMTTVTGSVGEWLLVGGVAERVEQSKSTTGTVVSTRSEGNSGIWIRADLVQ